MKELWKNFVYDIKKSPFRWFFIISLFFMVAFCILFNHGDSHLFHMWSINIWDAIFHGHIHDYFEYTAKFEWMGNPYSVLIYVPQAIWNFPIWLLHEIDNSINLAQPGFWAWSKMFYVLCTYVTAVYLRKTLNFFNIDKYWRDLAVVLCFGAISMMVSIGEAGQDEMLYIMLFTMGGYCLLRDKIKTALSCFAASIVCAPFMILPTFAAILVKRVNIFKFLSFVVGFLAVDKLFSYWWGYAHRTFSNVSIDSGFQQYFDWFFERMTFGTPHGVNVSIFAMVMILILGICYLYHPKEQQQQNKNIITYPAIILLSMGLLCWNQAYRLCICVPAMIGAMFVATNDKKDFKTCALLLLSFELTQFLLSISIDLSWLFRFCENPFYAIGQYFAGTTYSIGYVINGNYWFPLLIATAMYAIGAFITYYILKKNKPAADFNLSLNTILWAYFMVPLFVIVLYFGTAFYLKNSMVVQSDLSWNDKSGVCGIENNHVCAQEFVLNKPTKKLKVSVRTIAWDYKYNGTNMMVSLWRDKIGGDLVKTKQIPMNTVHDQEILKFNLSKINADAGKYVISFSSNEKQPISLATQTKVGGQSYIHDKNIEKDEILKMTITK